MNNEKIYNGLAETMDDKTGLLQYISTVFDCTIVAANDIYEEMKRAGADLMEIDALDWDEYLDAYLKQEFI